MQAPSKTCTLKEFEDKTALSLVTFVDMASDQLWQYFEKVPQAAEITAWNRSDALLDRMSERMCGVYSHNTSFRKKCHAADPREFVRTFVQHWVASDFIKQFPSLKNGLPAGFGTGTPILEGAREILVM